jgi:uncharacterized membrane protein
MYPYLVLSAGPYPNSALAAGQLAIMAVVPVLSLTVWLIVVFAAARKPRHPDAAETMPLPQQPRAQEHKRQHREQKAA